MLSDLPKYSVPILAFLAKPMVKYIGIAIAAALLLVFLTMKWNGFKETLREEGRQQMVVKYQGIVAKNNQDNRRIEQSVQASLDGYDKRLDTALKAMDAKQRKSAQTVLDIIQSDPQRFNNPVCTTPQSVMDARNEIRKAGPK